MVFVDSSIWITAFRNRDSRITAQLCALLDGNQVALAIPVKVELFSGAKRADLIRLNRVLSALPTYFPTNESWLRIFSWIEEGKKKGKTFGMADMLIASISVENSAELWSLDKDFIYMSELGFLRIYEPRILD